MFLRLFAYGILLTACAARAPSAPATPTEVRATASSSVVAEGVTAPDFVGPGSDGTNVALSALRGRTVILFFYSRDETPSAIREAIDFRDAWSSLRQQGVVVVGVSTDPMDVHRPFAERLDLPFSLVADPNGVIARAYGVPTAYGIADRQTFVIGPSGTVEKVYRDVAVERHVAEVVAFVAN